VSVDYATSNGTAADGSDYTATSGTLTWDDGDDEMKSFDVSITNDTVHEDEENFSVTLSNPAGGAALGSPNGATVTIQDDDVP
jgi:hypothetical protein